MTASGGFGGSDGTGQFASKEFTRYDYLADVSYYLGAHDLKAGFAYQQVDANVLRTYSGGQLVVHSAAAREQPGARSGVLAPVLRFRGLHD